MRNHQRSLKWALLSACGAVTLALLVRQPALGELKIGDICRVKGQERNTLQGMGLVTGLKGTGDGKFGPTARALIEVMTKMHILPAGSGNASSGTPPKLDAKNTALVIVTAEIPAQGGRRGDELECVVTAINAKSLEGGVLFATPLIGPRPPKDETESPRTFAFARGALQVENTNNPTTAVIPTGCRLEAEISNPFVLDDKITLVLDRNHARFRVAEYIEHTINRALAFVSVTGKSDVSIAKAVDQLSIEVVIPEDYRQAPVQFVSLLLEQSLYDVPNDAAVIVNERTGVIAISADLEIEPTAITHESMAIVAGSGLAASQFVELDPGAETSLPRLQALVQALNALRVPAKDVIQIIRELDAKGAIHGRVIYRR